MEVEKNRDSNRKPEKQKENKDLVVSCRCNQELLET